MVRSSIRLGHVRQSVEGTHLFGNGSLLLSDRFVAFLGYPSSVRSSELQMKSELRAAVAARTKVFDPLILILAQ